MTPNEALEALKRLAKLKKAKTDAWNSSDPMALAFADAAWYAVADSTDFPALAEAVEGMAELAEAFTKLPLTITEPVRGCLEVEYMHRRMMPSEAADAIAKQLATLAAANAEIARLRERVEKVKQKAVAALTGAVVDYEACPYQLATPEIEALERCLVSDLDGSSPRAWYRLDKTAAERVLVKPTFDEFVAESEDNDAN